MTDRTAFCLLTGVLEKLAWLARVERAVWVHNGIFEGAAQVLNAVFCLEKIEKVKY